MATRRRLDREAVVRAAEDLVDRDGAAQLTMSALATELGVRPPSLYSHVESVEALLGYVQERALRDLGTELRSAAMGTSGAAGVRALAEAQRDFATKHPGRYALAMAEPVDLDAMTAAGRFAGEALEAVVRSFGVDPMPKELAFTCQATLYGVLALDQSGIYRHSELDRDAVYETAIGLIVHSVEQAARG